jgi:hypothetical protein
MREVYVAFLSKGSADYLSPAMIGRWNKDEISLEDVRRHCNIILGDTRLEYNERASVEVWWKRSRGPDKLVYERQM